MITLAEKICNSRDSVVFFELIPPPVHIDPAELNAYLQSITGLLEKGEFDAINIPEIRNGDGKWDTRVFAQKLQEIKPFEAVVNRCSVCSEDQEAWLQETAEVYGIRHLILVGGESGKIEYPGLSVVEMADKTRERFFLGGITIPSRSGEVERLIEKGKHGIEYFTSQVIFETAQMQQLLKEYDRLCKEKGMQPKRIFLSFAPLSTLKDLKMFLWLGVMIPPAVEKLLFEQETGVGTRSVQIAKALLEEILSFKQKEGIDVPLGLNCEHILRHNFDLFQELIGELGSVYGHRS